MIKREAKLQTRFNKWIKYRWKNGTAKFELKVTKGLSIPFSDVKPHQRAGLLSPKLIYKISDADFISQKPFDCFVMIHAPGYVVLHWVRRGNKRFYIIDITRFLMAEQTSQRKSLTEDKAKQIAYIIGELED